MRTGKLMPTMVVPIRHGDGWIFGSIIYSLRETSLRSYLSSWCDVLA